MSQLITSVRGLFTAAAIVQYLKTLPVLKTPVIDTIFANRPQLGLPVVGRDEVNTVVRAMPFIQRGAASIPIAGASGLNEFYEPLPISPNIPVGAHELNNLKLLGQMSQEAWAQQKTDVLRRTIRATTEAVAAQALTGSLVWPIQLEGGAFSSYSVDFGAPVAYNPAVTWDANEAKIQHIMTQLQDMQEALQANGYGGEIAWWAGTTAYQALLGIVGALPANSRIRAEITQNGIDVGGFLIQRRTEKHRNPQSGAMVPVVGDKNLLAIATDGNHMMPYCAIDDLDANLQPLPMFVKPIKQDDPSGIKLVGNSKPFPSPNMKAICKAQVIT